MKKISFVIAMLLLPVLLFAQTTPDPGTPGSLAVARDTFDLGDLAFKPDSFATNVEMRGVVYYPSGLPAGPYPVLFLMHGRHATAYNVTNPAFVNLTWPPASGFSSITSFEGYNYFAQLMASQGFIVISVSVNAINARDNARTDLGMNARAQAMQHYMDLWKGFNTTGGAPFGTKFVGKLDMNRIGTMGHSRGGEGVVYHALLNQSLGSPYGVKAVLTLAPIDNGRKVLNNIPLMNIAPYCDGDVTALSGVHFYDDARYNVAGDTTPKHSVLIMGANHNFFNTVWTPGSYIAGTSDDGDDFFGTTKDVYCSSKRTGSGRLDTTTQKAAFCAYAAAFFRRYVVGDTTFAPLLEVTDRIPPVSSKMTASKVFVSWHPGVSKRLDINRIQSTAEETINTLGGAVSKSSSLTAYGICGGGGTMSSCAIATSATQEPHRGSSTSAGMAQLNMRWASKTDFCTNELPAIYKDISGYAALSFRVAVNFKYAAPNTDFTVAITDSFGQTSRVLVSKNTSALFYPPGLTSGTLPKIVFNTVKIPLDSFTGVNLTKVSQIHFLLDTVASGAILIGDLALVAFADRCTNIAAAFADTTGSAYVVRFGDQSLVNPGDTLHYYWTFGDPASGLANMASVAYPKHTFSGPGSYKVCLALEVKRTTGNICRDTFCKTLTLLPNSIQELTTASLNVYPNPAKDRLILSGINAGDVWELKTIHGQVIVRAIADKQEVLLPSFLANGLYLVSLHTRDGSRTFKVQLQR